VGDDPVFRQPFRQIEGGTVRMADTTWHKWWAELAHLDALGLIDDDEQARAVERLEAPLGTVRYEPLANE
jgi:hypothetical protein